MIQTCPVTPCECLKAHPGFRGAGSGVGVLPAQLRKFTLRMVDLGRFRPVSGCLGPRAADMAHSYGVQFQLYAMLTRHVRPAGAEPAGNLPKSARKAPPYRKNPQRSGMHPKKPARSPRTRWTCVRQHQLIARPHPAVEKSALPECHEQGRSRGFNGEYHVARRDGSFP
jgi:hypothetical protein